MPALRIPNGFTPRTYQRRAMRFFDKGGKRAFTVWHRRGGKDLTAMHQTCKAMHRRMGVYWHVFPTQAQARKALWEGFTSDGQRIMEMVFPKAIRKAPRDWTPNAEMVVELKCGSIWRLLGSDKMEVVGAGPVGVVFSEFALAKPRTWDLIRPMLRENGGWAWIITTPRGNNHAKKLFDRVRTDANWFCDTKTLYDTRAYDPEATIAEERASGMPEEMIAQEYLCDWNAANVGSFYGASLVALERAGGLGSDFVHETDDVFTCWDLGKADDTAIWWWRLTDDGVDVLDHYASHGEELEHYFAVLEERSQRHGWRYRKHFLPHDARQKRLGTKASIQEQFEVRYSRSQVAICPELSVRDGIAAVRRLLQGSLGVARIHPRCSLQAGPKDCDGVDALRSYHREWDDDNKCFRETPVHDWSSHTADSFRYLALSVEAVRGLMPKAPASPPPIDIRNPHYGFSLDELYSAHGR